MTPTDSAAQGEAWSEAQSRHYDALLVLSFGGPEGVDEVRPFLENVLRGRGVPPERQEEVAQHYLRFGGVSPINAQNRALIAALDAELSAHGERMPIYFGNRNWHPFLADALRRMRDDGVERALVFVTSAFSSYSGCRQYREDLARAATEIGPDAPVCDKLRVFYNHPGYVAACADRIAEARERLPAELRARATVVFTAHSIPLAMARHSAYTMQLAESAQLVAAAARIDSWRLAYQSRSGPPQVPWLEPDIMATLDELHHGGTPAVIVQPIGFLSDHMEVKYDLDLEAAEHAAARGLPFARAGTAGTHHEFVRMIRLLIEERRTVRPERLALGGHGPSHDFCATSCCLRS